MVYFNRLMDERKIASDKNTISAKKKEVLYYIRARI
jgi:hypothetical protein